MFDEKVSVEHYKLLKFPTSSHLLIALDHIHSNFSSLLIIVVNAVIPNELVPAKDAPGVIVLAVPLSVILISIISPSFGVPLKFVVNDVMFVASPVMTNMSPLSVLMVGVAPAVTVTDRFVLRLLVVVCVSVVPTTVPEGAVFPAHVVKSAS